jgi:hypothetical protein
MKIYGEVEVWLYAILTSALDGGGWSASSSDRFTPGERTPVTHWIEPWAGPRASLGAVAKRQIPAPTENRTPVIQHVA